MEKKGAQNFKLILILLIYQVKESIMFKLMKIKDKSVHLLKSI